MPQTAHFEVSAKDPSRLAAFYLAAFGWHVSLWGRPPGDWSVVMGAEGIPVNKTTRHKPRGMACMANTVEVDNIDYYLMRVKAAGGSVESEKQAVTYMGYLAYCADVEGNVFAIWQSDPDARN